MDTVLLRSRGAYGLTATATTSMAREGGHGSRNSGSPGDSQNEEGLVGIPSRG